MDIVTQERLLEDYNKAELQFIIPLDLNGHDLIMSSSPTTNTHCSFEDYTKDKSALIMKGLGPKGRLISYVFNHPIKQLKRRHSSIFLSSRQQEQLVAFRYPKTVDVHTLRSITIRYLIGLSPPYLSQKHVP
jgi:hypothetical protein